MTGLMKEYPQYLGIGLDEGTAIVVTGATAEVIGRARSPSTTIRDRPPATSTTPWSRLARSTIFRHAKESRSERAQVLAAPLMAGSDFEQPVTLRTRTNSTRRTVSVA